MEGVIPCDLHVFPQVGIPHVGNMGLHSTNRASREEVLEEHSQVVASEKEHIQGEQDLGGEVDHPPCDLAAA